MHWWRIILGFALSIVGGDLVLHVLIDKCLWPKVLSSLGLKAPKFTLTRQVGWLERLLYTLALYIGVWQWIGAWLAIKVAARWRSTSGPPYGSSDNIWLLGTGISVLFGFLGAWVALGHLPLKDIIH
jgi:hypothetical protein